MGPRTVGPIIARPDGSVPGVKKDLSISCRSTPGDTIVSVAILY